MTGPNGTAVLHVLRCIGYAELPRVADAAGLPGSDAESHLIDLAAAGLATRASGAWGLTEAGHAEDARRTARELDTAGTRDALTAAYERFMVLNPELLDLCSAWQLRSMDGRSDPSYDARVLERFADLHLRADDVIADLAAALPRFVRYRVRFGAALDRARAGAMEHLADSMTSYHTVWFQLHEDLLATLGIPRPWTASR